MNLVNYTTCAPTEIRTPVLGLKGPRPGPLDDGGKLVRAEFYHVVKVEVKIYGSCRLPFSSCSLLITMLVIQIGVSLDGQVPMVDFG